MHRTRIKLEAVAFTLPSLLLTLALGIYPIFWAIRYMFYEYAGYGTPKFVGLYNFERLYHDERFWNAVTNTLVYAGGKLLVTLPLSLLLAVLLNRRMRGAGLFKTIFFMPTVLSASVMSIVFYVIFNSYNGMINQLLQQLGWSRGVEWLGANYAMLTMILIAIWGAVGNYMLLFLAGLQGIPRDIYESASIDGARPVQQFFYITIPMLGPVLQMVMLLAITVSLKGYESIMVLTQGGPFGKTDVMFLYVYKMFFPVASTTAEVQQFGYGSAVGFAAALLIGAVTLIYFYASKKLNSLY
ncbi:carbohydrate ABC transporter permease [Cohnella rhizosphaerae]|uniref:Sugar ABC transporter permease n=1 Tax=Cohnella rhizosphaerae TaxID=1457232 RepID=A0A9X4L0M6_9BACL|nr:sugar ABC transporter permease [Cohnella rhizosphaerae]MDG0811342.1 sugar ABC transporter permease [Cohnella rhizosphaerae]